MSEALFQKISQEPASSFVTDRLPRKIAHVAKSLSHVVELASRAVSASNPLERLNPTLVQREVIQETRRDASPHCPGEADQGI